jgi:hypothetical protein
MKGERLFVERQTGLLEHLIEEKDSTVKFKLAFLKCFSELGSVDISKNVLLIQ